MPVDMSMNLVAITLDDNDGNRNYFFASLILIGSLENSELFM